MTTNVGIRLSAQGAAEVRAALEQLGPAGQRALRQVENAAREAQRESAKLSVAMQGALKWAGRLGAGALAGGALDLLRRGFREGTVEGEKLGRAIGGMANEWDRLGTNVAKSVLPAAERALSGITAALRGFNDQIERNARMGDSRAGARASSGNLIDDPLGWFLGRGPDGALFGGPGGTAGQAQRAATARRGRDQSRRADLLSLLVGDGTGFQPFAGSLPQPAGGSGPRRGSVAARAATPDFFGFGALAAATADSRAGVLAEGRSFAERFATDAERFAQQVQQASRLLSAGAISQETYNRAVAAAAPVAEQATAGFTAFRDSVLSGIEDMIFSARSLEDVAAGVLRQIASAALRETGGDLLSGALRWLGFRDAGGPMLPGRAYLTGERRPEVVVPSVPSSVVPVVPGRGARGSMAVTVNVSLEGANGDAAIAAAAEEAARRGAREGAAAALAEIDRTFPERMVRAQRQFG